MIWVLRHKVCHLGLSVAEHTGTLLRVFSPLIVAVLSTIRKVVNTVLIELAMLFFISGLIEFVLDVLRAI